MIFFQAFTIHHFDICLLLLQNGVVVGDKFPNSLSKSLFLDKVNNKI